jgi:mRNA-degrading endonuclease RelE of RelBE toxin-antitoxin system
MTVPNNETHPNSGDLKDIWGKLVKGERVELSDAGLAERFRTEKLMQKKRENFNIAVKTNGRVIRLRSGGYEIKIDIDKNQVTVYKDGTIVHEYSNACLVQNLVGLLFRLVKNIPEERWITFSFEKTVPEARRMQAWVLAVITNFSRPLKHNPLVC